MTDNAAGNGALIASPQTQALTATQNTELVPRQPEGMDDAEATNINNAAAQMVEQFRKSPTSLQLARTIGSLGEHSQFQATKQTALFQVRLKPLMEVVAKGGGPIPEGLDKMRAEVKKIDPETIMKSMNQGWVGTVLSRVSGKMRDLLTNIAQQYDSAEEVINGIVEGLLKAKSGLLADNNELAGISTEVEECLGNVCKDAFQSELVFQGINSLPVPDASNALAVRARTAIMQRLIGRIQDLRTMEALLLQLETEMHSIFNDNNDLADTIDRAATITRVLLTVGLINAIALHKQKQTIGVVKGQRQYNTKLLQTLASAAGLGAIEVAKLLDEPAVTFQGLQTAYATLTGHLDTADTIKANRIEKAQAMLPKLADMATNLQQRIEGLKAVAELPEPETT